MTAGLMILDRFIRRASSRRFHLDRSSRRGRAVPVRFTIEHGAVRNAGIPPIGRGRLRATDFKLERPGFRNRPFRLHRWRGGRGTGDCGPAGAPRCVFGFHPAFSGMRYELATPLLFANLLRWVSPEIFRQWEIGGGSYSTALPQLWMAGGSRPPARAAAFPVCRRFSRARAISWPWLAIAGGLDCWPNGSSTEGSGAVPAPFRPAAQSRRDGRHPAGAGRAAHRRPSDQGRRGPAGGHIGQRVRGRSPTESALASRAGARARPALDPRHPLRARHSQRRPRRTAQGRLAAAPHRRRRGARHRPGIRHPRWRGLAARGHAAAPPADLRRQ